jgi:co-chaperonin GroES (HSP10)
MVNTSGLACLEFNVLVKEEEGDLHKRFKAAGLQLAGEAADRDKHASTIGHIINVSPTAFTYEDWKGQDDMKPKAGDRVVYAKYAGTLINGKDGAEYRIVKDKDILAMFTD